MNNNAGGITVSDFKPYYRNTVKKKKEKQKHGNGHVDQWAKIGNLSMNTCNYSPLILTKMPKVHARGQIASSKGTKKAGCPHVEEQN